MKILIILTSHDRIGDSDRKTGLWFEELTTLYYVFRDAGAEVDIASVAGGQVPVDPHSIEVAGKNPVSVDRFLAADQHPLGIAATQRTGAAERTVIDDGDGPSSGTDPADRDLRCRATADDDQVVGSHGRISIRIGAKIARPTSSASARHRRMPSSAPTGPLAHQAAR